MHEHMLSTLWLTLAEMEDRQIGEFSNPVLPQNNPDTSLQAHTTCTTLIFCKYKQKYKHTTL